MFEKRTINTEKKAKVKETKERKIAPKDLAIPFVLAAVVVCFIYIVITGNADKDILKKSVVTAKKSITANELITRDNAGEYFTETTMDMTNIPEGSYGGLSELPEKFYTGKSFAEKEMILANELVENHAVMDKYTAGTTMTSIAVKSFESGVSGIIRHGDIVDVYATDPETKQLVLMAENVYVDEAFNNSGEIVNEDGVAVAFNVLVAPGEENQMNTAIAYGGIQIYKK